MPHAGTNNGIKNKITQPGVCQYPKVSPAGNEYKDIGFVNTRRYPMSHARSIDDEKH